MVYATELRDFLKYYEEVVEPFMNEGHYMIASMEMGNLNFAFQDVMEKHQSEMPLRLRWYMVGFMARFKVLQDICYKEDAEGVEHAKEMLKERSGLVYIMVDALADKEVETQKQT